MTSPVLFLDQSVTNQSSQQQRSIQDLKFAVGCFIVLDFLCCVLCELCVLKRAIVFSITHLIYYSKLVIFVI